MINPKREWRKFESLEDKIGVLKELKLVIRLMQLKPYIIKDHIQKML